MKQLKKSSLAKGGGPSYPYFSKVLEKGLSILNLFTPENPYLNLKDITLKTGINHASTFRLVETLIQLGYLKKDPKTKLIRLGPMALVLTYNIHNSFDLIQIIKPHIDAVYDKFNVSVDAAVVEQEQFIIIYKKEATDTLVFNLPKQSKYFNCSAVGKAYLSTLQEEILSEFLDRNKPIRRTPHSLTNRAALLADLSRTRQRGYSINNEELALGLISFGSPLVNKVGNVLGIVSMDVSTVHYKVEEAERRFAPVILKLVQDIKPMLPV
jgi:IclR family pca regulon transcriptional regulator